jgi:hypothetical protein
MTGVSRQLPGVSNAIGLIEITTALLIASRPFSPKASFLGSLAAIITVLLTIRFSFSTPGALQLGHGISILGETGQFLIKDLVLLGASCCIAAEDLRAAGGKNQPAIYEVVGLVKQEIRHTHLLRVGRAVKGARRAFISTLDSPNDPP